MGWQAWKEEKDRKTFHPSVVSSPSGGSGIRPQNHAPVKLNGHDSGLGKKKKGVSLGLFTFSSTSKQ